MVARHPFGFQNKRNERYFEGWYFKNVANDGRAFSFIPGVSYDADGTGHAFVQTIRGSDGATDFQRFDLEDFEGAQQKFSVRVGPNRFSFDGMEVELPEVFGGITGKLVYSGITDIRRSFLRPGIMGWYRYVPFMECYHEVGSVDHGVSGSLTIGDETLSFDGGRGYLEKDWGTSMPSAWVWIQCNNFAYAGSSLMLSIARIPWLGRSFTGFLGFLAVGAGREFVGRADPQLSNTVLQFGTYSGARVTGLTAEGTTVAIEIALGRRRLSIRGERTHGGSLAAPVAGAMDRRIAESLNGHVQVELHGADDSILYKDEGRPAGIEVVGEMSELQSKIITPD